MGSMVAPMGCILGETMGVDIEEEVMAVDITVEEAMAVDMGDNWV